MSRLSRILPRTVILLGVVSLLNDFASEMVVPLIPVLLATVLAAGPVALGLVEGVADALASFLRLWSGRWSDSLGGRRKVFAVSGYLLSNAVRPLIGLAGSWPVLLLLRSVDRVGKGIRSAPRDALLADSALPGQTGFAFGYQRAMDNGGAVTGALVAAALLHYLQFPIQDTIFVSAFPGFLAVVLLAAGVREPSRASARAVRVKQPLDPRRLSPVMRRYLVTLGIFTLARATETFILLRGYDLGMGPDAVLLLWAFIHLAKSSTATLGGRLADRVGRSPVLLLGWLAYSGNYVLFALVDHLPALWAVSLSYGLFYGLGEGAERAQINDLATAEERGTAFGWYYLAVGISTIPAGVFFGWIWERWGAPPAFGFSAAVSLLSVFLLLSWVYRKVGGKD